MLHFRLCTSIRIAQRRMEMHFISDRHLAFKFKQSAQTRMVSWERLKAQLREGFVLKTLYLAQEAQGPTCGVSIRARIKKSIKSLWCHKKGKTPRGLQATSLSCAPAVRSVLSRSCGGKEAHLPLPDCRHGGLALGSEAARLGLRLLLPAGTTNTHPLSFSFSL